MKAYVKYRDPLSFAINRVIAALKEYAPRSIEFTEDWHEADIVVYHATGRLNKLIQESQCAKSYAVIQYTLHGSRNPNAGDWLTFWQDALTVWSYLDLRRMTIEDRVVPDFNFYYAPLGVDSRVFHDLHKERIYAICTSGGLFTTEGVRECYHAAKSLGKQIIHLGPAHVGRDKGFECYREVDDTIIANIYSQSEYVVGLRRTEGFELPAAEGILCGARPIVFDSPHYRQWYNGLAEFVPENGRQGVIDSISAILSRERRPVTEEEIAEAQRRFDWQKIVTGFWKRCLDGA